MPVTIFKSMNYNSKNIHYWILKTDVLIVIQNSKDKNIAVKGKCYLVQ